jgi:hypothetical protein
MHAVVSVTSADLKTLATLHHGESVSVGTCQCEECGHDILLDKSVPTAVRITALSSHWQLDNLHSELHCLVGNMESPAEFITVQPGRRWVPIPFELASVNYDGQKCLIIFGPEPQLKPTPHGGKCPSIQTIARLRTDTAYFHALVALCEPRLHNGLDAPLSGLAAIAARLTSAGRPMTPRAVRAHLDYVFARLDLDLARRRPGVRLTRWEMLAREVLRLGIVRPEHLRLVEVDCETQVPQTRRA